MSLSSQDARVPEPEPAVNVRPMRPGEFTAMRQVSIDAFRDDQQIGELLDALRESWAWEDDLAFVADLDGEVVGQVLYTHAFLDAPPCLVRVLVLSPIGVRPDLQRHGIGGAESPPTTRSSAFGAGRRWDSRHRRRASRPGRSSCIRSHATSRG